MLPPRHYSYSLHTTRWGAFKKGAYMIKDSGSRREFDTGAVRDNGNIEEKGRFDLVPWEVIWDLAKHFAKGSAKYGDNNWQKGIPVESYFDSAMRHLIKHKLGHDDEDHLISCLWNICCWAWEERYSPRAVKTLSVPKPKIADDLIKPTDVCELCGVHTKTYLRPNGKKVCAKCWNKEEDDLK